MLYEFLEQNREEILNITEEKTVKLAGPLASSTELRHGLPIFYEHLIHHLKNPKYLTEVQIVGGAADHGKELLRLNYTLSHVVHAYGAMCQAITELAQKKKAEISSQEFNDLNLCLDIAIAAAVSEFQFQSVQQTEAREAQHLGFLAHELRNALSSATVAHEMIKQGLVGTSGSTAKVLEENLARMRNLIDRSLSEVRMRADPTIHLEDFQLNGLVDQIIVTAQHDARRKQQSLTSEIVAGFALRTDRQLLLSAIANLIQNALKYTKDGGTIIVRGEVVGENTLIQVLDECGGLDPAFKKNLFKPFVSGGYDQSGLGLGLTIVQRAVGLLQGHIHVRDRPGHGCSFAIEMPTVLVPQPLNRAVTGANSAQPASIIKLIP
jgi:signal transduction histidine kinase